MKTHIFLVITAIVTSHAHAMDDHMILLHAKNYVMKDIKSPLLPQKFHVPISAIIQQLPCKTQTFPNEIWDKIIALCSHQDRKNVKETCKRLSLLTSINRLDKFVMHDFNIGNRQDKTVLFKAIIKTSNPELITVIMNYAKKETDSWWSYGPDSVCIDLEPCESAKKQYIQKYATRLMQEALEQENAIMINALEKEDYDPDSIDSTKEAIKYRKKIKTDNMRCNCITGCIVTGLLGLMSFVIYSTSYVAKYGNHTHSPITIPTLSFY